MADNQPPDDSTSVGADESAVQIASESQQQQQHDGDNDSDHDTTKVVAFPVALAPSRNPEGKQTDEEVELALMALVNEGNSVRASSKILSIPLRTAYHILARNEENIDALRATTRKLLAVGALDRIEDWKIASEVGARKKGNHVPARDWLLHAGVIDSVQGDGVGGVRIAINIGTDDKPMRLRSPLRESDEG